MNILISLKIAMEQTVGGNKVISSIDSPWIETHN